MWKIENSFMYIAYVIKKIRINIVILQEIEGVHSKR